MSHFNTISAFISSFTPTHSLVSNSSTNHLCKLPTHGSTLRMTATPTPPIAPARVQQNADIQRLHPGQRFCQAVTHGNIVYLSGQVARGTDGSVSEQTRAILQKIDTLLADAGTDKTRILSAMIWVSDISRVSEMNAEWERWVDPQHKPARACVQAALVDDEITVEIQVTAALPSKRKIVDTDLAAAAVGPYNQAVVVEDGTVYVSGCIGLEEGSGNMAGDTVQQQTTQALKNLKAIVEAAGASVGDVVKTTVLLDDIGDFAEVNKLYSQFFQGGPVPARSCFAAKQLPKGALVEIEAIAKIP